ncbi:MAG: hypothetical protein ACFBSC_04305 [Microcoleaceae cyanobacterium]
MERGLLWLPLLGVFIWLAWTGWNEYQKVEAYRSWAKGFQYSKYDIYAVLGQNGMELTWGKPSRKGPIELEQFSLDKVQSIWLLVDNKSVDLEQLPKRGGEIELEFQLWDEATPVRIPFTELPLATEWIERLQTELQALEQTPQS